MRGLPFPQDAVYNREQSHEFGTPGPASTPGLGDISLDPALAGHATAPIFIPNGAGPSVSPQDISPLSPSMAIQRYAQGPQGDPFAPQPPLYGYPNLNSKPNMSLPPKPVKRKRRPRREEICGFCGGNDSRNPEGDQEPMGTCDECGRSGHPSCMELGEIGDAIRSYPWKCAKCKSCEICHEKGADGRMLFCDNCDRGWHMDCLDPPMQETPEGKWYCPLCPTLPPVHESESVPPLDLEPAPEPELPIDPALQMDIDPALREASVASSSHHSIQPEQPSLPKSRARGRRDRKGKGRAVLSEDEEDNQNIDVEAEGEVEPEVATLEEDMEEEVTFRTPASRRKSTNNRKRGKGRPRRRSESVPDDGESPGPPLRPPKRIRLVARPTTPEPTPRPRKTVRLRFSNQKGKGKARDEDEDEEAKKGMFDDILNVEDRDTMKTTIVSGDKERFDKARNGADSKLAVLLSADSSDSRARSPGPSTITGRFPLRSVVHQLQRIQTQSQLPPSHPESPSPSTPGPSHKFDPNVLRIRTIRFGPYDIQTWYDAPFPEEFSNIPDGRLWICEFCLKYMKSRFGAQRHRLKCKCRHPPGDEIYRDGSISIFEVDGRRNKIYCQNLCLLSKMFLDHKSLFYDVEPFLFYVMTEVDDIGARFVGYFSKEKRSPKDLNLSCIMTLPVRQRQGWGNLLIDFSYLLSKKEQKSGTPERPLSALGAIGYKKYWTLALMRYLQTAPLNPRLEDIGTATSMSIEDIYNTLLNLNMITVHDSRSSPVRPSPGRSIKLNRRKVGIARRNLQKAQPKDDDKSSKSNFAPPTDYDVHWDKDEVEKFLTEWESKGYLTLNPDRLKWTPFLLSRNEKQILFQPFLEDGAIVVANTETPQASGSATAESNKEGSAGADVFADSPRLVDSPMEEEAPSSSGVPQVDQSTEDPKILKLGFPSPIEPEDMRHESPTPMPSPTRVPPSLPPRVPKPRSSTNGLEALAAVAVAVSKANPTPMRRKSSSSTTASPSAERAAKLNGDLDSCLTSTPILTSLKLSIPTQVLVERDAENAEPHMKVETPTPLELTGNGRSHAMDGRFPISAKRTQSVSPLGSTAPNDVHKDAEIEKDAELAARLAREDSVQRRSLRSLHSTPAVTAVNTKDVNKDALRKRRKAATSPASETSPLTPLTPDRPTTRAQAHAQALETARSNRLTRSQSTRLSTNGSLPNGDSQTPSGLRTSSRLNGVSPSKSIMTPTPLKPLRVRSSTRNEDRRETENRSARKSPSPTLLDDSHVEDDDADAEGESDIDAEGEPDVVSEEETRNDEMAVSILNTNGDYQQNGHVSTHIEESILRNSSSNSVSTVHPGSPTLSSLSFSLSTSNILSPSEPTPDGFAPQLLVNGHQSSGMDVEDEDLDAEGEPDDEDAEGELDTEMYQ